MMNHDRAVTLAAIALDFPLSPKDATDLAAHEAACDRCRSRDALLRRDADALADLEVAVAPPELREAVLWGAGTARLDGRRSARGVSLLLVAALGLIVLAGGAVAGSLLRNEDDSDNEVVLDPSASATVGPDDRIIETPSPSATATTPSSAAPTRSATPPPADASDQPTDTPSPDNRPVAEIDHERWARPTTQLNLRTEPSTQAPVIRTLGPSDVVYVTDAMSRVADGYTWYRVVTLDDEVGWVAGHGGGEVLLTHEGVTRRITFCAHPTQRAFVGDGTYPVPRAELLVLGNLPLRSDPFSTRALAAADLAHGEALEVVCATMPIEEGRIVRAGVTADYLTCGNPVASAVEYYLQHEQHQTSGFGAVHEYLFGQSVPYTAETHPNLLMLAGAGFGSRNDRVVCIDVSAAGASASTSTLNATITADVCATVVSLDSSQITMRGRSPWSTQEYRFERNGSSNIDPTILPGRTMGIGVRLTNHSTAVSSMRPVAIAGCV